MRKLIYVIFIFISVNAFSQEEADSTRNPLKVSGTVSLNSNGIAPIPAFSLGKPALIAALSLKKNRFSYDPQLSYGLDIRPWIIDNWLHYRVIEKPEFELKTGFDASMFFSEYKTPDEVILRGQRYATFELAGIYKMSRKSSLSFVTWYDRGLDKGTLIGYFFNLVADRSDISVGKHLLMDINVQIFYIDYTGKNDGLFISPKISSSVRNLPFSITFQAIQTVNSNISPFPKFRWNLGLAYSF